MRASEPPAPSPGPTASRSARAFLFVLLAISAVLRFQLASRGGQGYWPDEHRYDVSRAVVAAASGGQWREAAGDLLGSSDHLFFRFIGLIPAALERACFRADAVPPGFAAGFFGLFAVGAIALVWLIARQETRDEPTATWCAFFYAGCVTAFLFNRHYFPYDPAICLLLLGWWIGLRSHTPFGHWLTGATVGLGYLTYNGYWNLGAVILIFHVLRPRRGLSPFVRGGWATLGLVSPILVFVLLGRAFGYDLIANAREFSHTVTQGGFGRGWQVIPSYFASSEGLYGALLLGLTLAGLGAGLRRGLTTLDWLWAAMGLALATEMIFFSDVLPRFALSGRMIKPLALFLALGAGLAAGRLGFHRTRDRALTLVALAVVLAAINFHTPLSLEFPLEFRREAEAIIATERARDPAAPLQMYYADFMHLPEFLPAYPPHVVLRQRMHPLQYQPYQFEGYDGPTRQAFRAHDFSMRLVRRTGMDPWQTDFSRVGGDLRPYAGAIQLEIDLPFPRPAGHTEPLVTAGIPGQADLFLIHYLDHERIELLVDHWNWGLLRSDPIRVPAEAGQPHQLVLCAGSLLPPASHPAVQHDPDLQVLSQQAILVWDGAMVLRKPLPAYPTPASGLAVGGNYVAGTSTEMRFTGRIRQVRQIDPRLAMRREWGVNASVPAAGLEVGRLGPQRMEVEWDPVALHNLAAEATLLALRDAERTAMLTARSSGANTVFSLWLQGARVAESSPEPVAAGPHRLEFWTPLLVSTAKPAETFNPILGDWLQTHSVLLLDGRVVLRHDQSIAGTAAREIVPDGPPAYFLTARAWPLDAPADVRPFPGRITAVTAVPLQGPVLLRA